MRHLRSTAFLGNERLAAGELQHVALKMKQRIDAGAVPESVRVFDDRDGRLVSIDWQGSEAEFLRRLGELPNHFEAEHGHADNDDAPAVPAKRGRGRPRLGVVAREVTLLPRHWQWLNAQPGGASVALRKLVEAARDDHAGLDDTRRSQEAAYRFIQEMLGDGPQFETAARALFAGNAAGFDEATAQWPEDIREHALLLGKDALKL